MKKGIIYLLIILVVGILVFFVVTNLPKKEKNKNEDSNITSNSNSNINEEAKDTIAIDYNMYQQLRSEVYENDTFAILIMSSSDDDDISKTFRREILYSFKDKKSKIYELDVTKLSKAEYSGVIDDVTKLQNYKEPTIIIPTMILSKKGKVVYVQEGLAYSTDLIPNIEKNDIE